MRKVVWLMHVSLDGLATGPNGEIDWVYLDDEMFEDVHDLVSAADTALFGRVTYELMESYWPTAASRSTATTHDVKHSRWLNSAPKIVFSRTLKKKQPGKNLILFASPSLASTFINLDLIDEHWSNVNPVVLGKGKPLFKDLSNMHKLKLLDTKTYKNGVVNLQYGRAS